MKMSIAQAMKYIKELSNKKDNLLNAEESKSTVSYKEGDKPVLTQYSYSKTRKEIEKINAETRKIKHAIAVANCSIKVADFDMSIGEALIYLAQLNLEMDAVDELCDVEKLYKKITYNGIVQCTECLYEPSKAEEDRDRLFGIICKLQLAIDRANYTTEIEF